MMLIPINKHISTLAKILFSTEEVVFWGQVHQWLTMAASIENIDIDTIKNNDSFGWCRASDEYDLARDEMLKIFIFNLTIFNFVWGALESCLDLIPPPKHPDKRLRGKITDASYHIGSFTRSNTLPALVEQTIKFKSLADKCYGFDKINTRINKIKLFGLSGVGLNAVYELRNKFAHGSLNFPELGSDDEPTCIENDLVICATRIVLFSLQLLLIKHYTNVGDYSIYLIDNGFGLEGDIPLLQALRHCHIAASDDYAQLNFEY